MKNFRRRYDWWRTLKLKQVSYACCLESRLKSWNCTFSSILDLNQWQHIIRWSLCAKTVTTIWPLRESAPLIAPPLPLPRSPRPGPRNPPMKPRPPVPPRINEPMGRPNLAWMLLFPSRCFRLYIWVILSQFRATALFWQILLYISFHVPLQNARHTDMQWHCCNLFFMNQKYRHAVA